MRRYAENMMPKLFILLWKQGSVFHLSNGLHFCMVTWRISHTCSLLSIRFVKVEMLISVITVNIGEYWSLLQGLKRQLVGDSYVFKYQSYKVSLFLISIFLTFKIN